MSAPTLATATVRDERKVIGEVRGLDPIKCPFRSGYFRPNSYVLRMHRENGGAWEFTGLRVGGPLVLKSGTDSESVCSDRNWDKYSLRDGRVPDWAVTLIEQELTRCPE